MDRNQAAVIARPGGKDLPLTRKILAAHAGEMLATASSGEQLRLVELGAGSADKTRLRFNLISGSSLLKWLNSLYRPAWPEGIRGKGVLPDSGGAIGASPSGKAVDFDSTIRRFESSRPSQAFAQLKIVRNHITKSPLNTGFLAFCAASPRPEKWQPSREIAESLQPTCGIFPFSGDSARRPFSICTAR